MDLPHWLILYLPNYGLDLLQTLLPISELLVGHPVLHYHQLLPVFQDVGVFVAALIVIFLFEESLENINKLTFHQEIPHCLHNIMVSSSGQQHVIDPLPKKRIDNADKEQPEHIEIPHHLQDRILWQIKADGPDDRLFAHHNFANINPDGGNIE